jgi:protocatechuate 3,4-dioxygenase beta subunit
VPPGRYNVVAVAPAMVGSNEGQDGQMGKTVTIAEGETVEKIDFSLVRGGVISGRVTDSDGAPVIGEHINLLNADKNQRMRGSYSSYNPFMFETDDRGIYRLYGIPAGRYTVSIGNAPEEGAIRYGNRGYYARTFYPGVTDESKATIMEVTEGSEALSVDITLGRKSQTFAAMGRVIDENGQPVPNIRVGNGSVMKDQNRMGSIGYGALTDDKGRFRLDGMLPGRYAAFIWGDPDVNGYGDPVLFDVAEGDVSGLELKLRRGSSISGIAVIEGTTDRSVLAKLSQLSVSAGSSERTETLTAPTFSNTKIAPDGSFHITGLRPGKVRLYLSMFPPPPGFTLARVERDGVPQREIEVAPGAQVTGVRVVFEYGTGSIHGAVKVENGSLPEGLRMNIFARRLDEAGVQIPHGSQVDSRGRFLIEGLAAGEYEVTLQGVIMLDRPRPLPPIKQSITVTNGVDSELNFTLDLNAKPKEGSSNE